MKATLPIETSRLVLRNFLHADAEAVHRYASDPEVVRYLDWGPNTEKDTSRFVEIAMEPIWDEPRLLFDLAIVLRRSGELIGACGLHLLSQRHRECEIGYCLSRQFWSDGYGTEAAQGLLTLGFGQLGLHRIQAMCHVANQASSRILEKLGMHQEGMLRQNRCQRGVWCDSYLYAILEEEWRSGGGSQIV